MPVIVVQENIEIKRTIRRLAHEIIENNQGTSELILVGILTRGATLAERIATEIENFEGVEIPTGSLDIVLHRDDLNTSGLAPRLQRSTIPRDLAGTTVVLVDDVLYTGRTCRAALDALMDYGRPASVRLAVYIDRGHRELPIRPDFVGRNIPTAPNQSILVELNEIDGIDRVSIIDEELTFVEMIESRNTLSHTYNEEQAAKIYVKCVDYLKAMKNVLAQLNKQS